MVIHIGPDGKTIFNYSNVSAEELCIRIINTGLKCRSYEVRIVAVSSIIKSNNFNINQVIYRVKNISKSFCRLNNFLDICDNLENENYL